MIMRTLNPSQHSISPVEMDAREATELIHAMVDGGTTVHTTDFYSPTREHVIVFWTLDSEGGVSTTWEHTMSNLPNIPATGEVREVMRTAYEVNDAEVASATGERETYSVGE